MDSTVCRRISASDSIGMSFGAWYQRARKFSRSIPLTSRIATLSGNGSSMPFVSRSSAIATASVTLWLHASLRPSPMSTRSHH